MFVFGVIFVADGFGQPIKETLDKLINLKVEDDDEKEKYQSMWINMFALFGALALLGGAIIILYMFYDWLKGRIQNLRRIWQYKHRFNKKPIAKCYCIDCRDYDEKNKFCRDLGRHVLDNTFCCWCKPDMSKKPNVKEEFK